MSIRWENSLSEGLAAFGAHVHSTTNDALADGGEVIIADAEVRVPKESGHLAGTGKVLKGRGGNNTVGLWFAGPYARWVHEHLWFKHPHGGEPKYLETAMLTKGREALRVAGERLWSRG